MNQRKHTKRSPKTKPKKTYWDSFRLFLAKNREILAFIRDIALITIGILTLLSQGCPCNSKSESEVQPRLKIEEHFPILTQVGISKSEGSGGFAGDF